MSDGYEQLAQTVREVEDLQSESGLDRASTFNLKDLSFHTSLPEADIRRLLDGEIVESPASDTAELARRIAFLRETRLTVDSDTGGRRQYTTAEIAAGSGMTPQWHGKLLNRSTPNIWHGAGLARFFDVPMEYFTHTPPEAVKRVLDSRVIPGLTTFLKNPSEAVRNRHAMQIQLRLGDRELPPDLETALMAFVDAIARENAAPSPQAGSGGARRTG
ncbi:hypothetical protein [Streptomyces antarcticus]|uniref:hypothetical protein n=1 Tax=Streptomyces antarcticus TaxID=2996458 RepID=UPI00227059FE|nr:MULTISPECIES: hypothetical protein [unclassified Streptomyces]MCY0944990.1 hypothetical protein [Streptomyces sp. H34-AA3]MCY0951517.1 hypothetical protein [Streptomyces sp. H27-S2]MCZ4082162.1 hypothetical protein [Streptomyces sp. H34-S5]